MVRGPVLFVPLNRDRPSAACSRLDAVVRDVLLRPGVRGDPDGDAASPHGAFRPALRWLLARQHQRPAARPLWLADGLRVPGRRAGGGDAAYAEAAGDFRAPVLC